MTQQMFNNRTGKIRPYDKSIAENNHGWYLILPSWVPYHTLRGDFIGFKVPGGYRHKTENLLIRIGNCRKQIFEIWDRTESVTSCPYCHISYSE